MREITARKNVTFKLFLRATVIQPFLAPGQGSNGGLKKSGLLFTKKGLLSKQQLNRKSNA